MKTLPLAFVLLFASVASAQWATATHDTSTGWAYSWAQVAEKNSPFDPSTFSLASDYAQAVKYGPLGTNHVKSTGSEYGGIFRGVTSEIDVKQRNHYPANGYTNHDAKFVADHTGLHRVFFKVGMEGTSVYGVDDGDDSDDDHSFREMGHGVIRLGPTRSVTWRTEPSGSIKWKFDNALNWLEVPAVADPSIPGAPTTCDLSQHIDIIIFAGEEFTISTEHYSSNSRNADDESHNRVGKTTTEAFTLYSGGD